MSGMKPVSTLAFWYASVGTIFLVHQASMFKFGFENASDIRAQNELMDIMRDRYIGKLVEHSKLTAEKWHELELRTTWFDSKQALDYGLIDAIE